METLSRSIDREALAKLFSRWRQEGRRVLAPRKIGDRIDFAEVSSPDEVSFDHVQTVQSPKTALFPRVEELFRFMDRDGRLELRGRDPDELRETVVFGLRPCDAAAFAALAAIFNWDQADSLFSARLQRTTLIGVSCSRSDQCCFCTSVGGGPGSTAGSDILLTDMGDGRFLAEVVSDKGRREWQRDESLFGPAGGGDKESRLAKVERMFDLSLV
ncbi:MAG: hydrogenase subunit beta, partial [Candidatus Aminicenantes bacterium]|nr:hydrogenase subunit beta [Candidatus Aminicenantes bacterium]